MDFHGIGGCGRGTGAFLKDEILKTGSGDLHAFFSSIFFQEFFADRGTGFTGFAFIFLCDFLQFFLEFLHDLVVFAFFDLRLTATEKIRHASNDHFLIDFQRELEDGSGDVHTESVAEFVGFIVQFNCHVLFSFC